MTTEDKTGDKLVASIRKTKAGATAAAPTGAKTAATTRRRAAPKAKAKTASTRATQSAAGAEPAAAYQSPGRVWPD